MIFDKQSETSSVDSSKKKKLHDASRVFARTLHFKDKSWENEVCSVQKGNCWIESVSIIFMNYTRDKITTHQLENKASQRPTPNSIPSYHQLRAGRYQWLTFTFVVKKNRNEPHWRYDRFQNLCEVLGILNSQYSCRLVDRMRDQSVMQMS